MYNALSITIFQFSWRNCLHVWAALGEVHGHGRKVMPSPSAHDREGRRVWLARTCLHSLTPQGEDAVRARGQAVQGVRGYRPVLLPLHV